MYAHGTIVVGEKPEPAAPVYGCWRRRSRSRRARRSELQHDVHIVGRWRRPTNVWREVTTPARGRKLPTSDRQRGAIFWAPPTGETPLGGQRCRSSPAARIPHQMSQAQTKHTGEMMFQ